MHTHARLINDGSFLNGPECSQGMGVSSVGEEREREREREISSRVVKLIVRQTVHVRNLVREIVSRGNRVGRYLINV